MALATMIAHAYNKSKSGGGILYPELTLTPEGSALAYNTSGATFKVAQLEGRVLANVSGVMVKMWIRGSDLHSSVLAQDAYVFIPIGSSNSYEGSASWGSSTIKVQTSNTVGILAGEWGVAITVTAVTNINYNIEVYEWI